ncbi:MAG: hypothetical protein ACWGON_09140 [Gemmatimonadota bacterium]
MRMDDGDYLYWLRFQIGLATAGIVVWLVGVALDSAFVSGLGTGVLIAALAIRFLRGQRPGEASEGDGD